MMLCVAPEIPFQQKLIKLRHDRFSVMTEFYDTSAIERRGPHKSEGTNRPVV